MSKATMILLEWPCSDQPSAIDHMCIDLQAKYQLYRVEVRTDDCPLTSAWRWLSQRWAKVRGVDASEAENAIGSQKARVTLQLWRWWQFQWVQRVNLRRWQVLLKGIVGNGFGDSVIIVATHPAQAPLFEAGSTYRVVYYCSDQVVTADALVRYKKQHKQLLQQASTVVVNDPKLLVLAEEQNQHCHLLTDGVALEHFRSCVPSRERARQGRVRIGVFESHWDERLIQWMQELITSVPGVDIVAIGPLEKSIRDRLPSEHLTVEPFVSYQRLPMVMADIDLFLVISEPSSFSQRTSVKQILASGKPGIAMATEGLREFGNELVLVDSAEEMLRKVQEFASGMIEFDVTNGILFAAEESWHAKAEQFSMCIAVGPDQFPTNNVC